MVKQYGVHETLLDQRKGRERFTRGVRRILERGRRGVGTKRRLRSPRKMRRTASKVSCCMDPGAQLPDYFAELRANSIGFQYRLTNSTNFEKVQVG